MTHERFDVTYEHFLANIALTNTQADRIDSKVAEMLGFFYSMFDDDIKFYLQGSYATGTIVKPLTEKQGGAGQYDVDIVIERTGWGNARDALTQIEELFADDTDYAPFISEDQKESCVRLEYKPDASTGVGFHVDVVPILNESGKKKVARRTANKWEESDSELLIEWTNNFFKQNPYARGILLSVKRLRDVGDYTLELTSIILLALLKDHYSDKGSYFDDLFSFLLNINRVFSSGLQYLVINNPINEQEDLLGKWRKDPQIFEGINKLLGLATQTLMEALEVESIADIREVLSTDFPPQFEDENVDSLRSQDTQINLSGKLRYARFITATAPNGHLSADGSEMLFFERSKAITFTAHQFDDDQDIYWQVNNARGNWEKRGEFFLAMAAGGGPGTSLNKAINHESEQYLGRHWIRYVGIKDGVADIISAPFYVRVMSTATSSAPNIKNSR